MPDQPASSSPPASYTEAELAPSPDASATAPPVIPFPSSPSPSHMPRQTHERAKTSTSRAEPSLAYNPAFDILRTRRTSLPANLIATRHHSIVGSSGPSTLRLKDKSDHRLSVASFSSIESVAEEDEGGESSGAPLTSSAPMRRPRAASRRSIAPPGSRPSSIARPPNPSRYSAPASAYHGAFQSFSAALPTGVDASKTSSPLGSTFGTEAEGATDKLRSTGEDRAKREERRWRIAEELRDTEKAYVQVLEEIDAHYYQPLIAALPATDPLCRRTNRFSTAGPPPSRSTSPNESPRASLYGQSSFVSPRARASTRGSVDSVGSSPSTAPSTPPTPHVPSGATLSRREINEVFSNFTDVLNLAHVMLLTLDEAVPLRPSQPVPLTLSPRSSLSPLVASPEDVEGPSSAPVVGAPAGGSSLESQAGGLSTSAETTASSTGPETPAEDGSPIPPAAQTRTRTMITQSNRRSRPPPAPPFRLGKALLPILPFLKQYSLFVANFSASLARLSSLEASPSAPVSRTSNGAPGSTPDDRIRWQAFASEAQKERIRIVGPGTGKIGLGGLLLNVVQRVPRYRLLLKELIEFTEEDHPDLRDLRTAFALVDGVASHLESQIQSHTNDLQILDLQRAFTNLESPLLTPGRRLLKTGFLRKLNRSGKQETRTFFLFNDILLHASGGAGEMGGWSSVGLGLGIANVVLGGEEGVAGGNAHYRLHRRLELEDVTVIGSDEVADGGLKYGLEILHTEKSIAVYADSLEVKTSWIEAIRDAKAALMSDRRTLQRTVTVEQVATSTFTPTGGSPRVVKRISLPLTSSPSRVAARSPISVSHLAAPPAISRQISLPPQLGQIPPTPAEELDQPNFAFPSSVGEQELPSSLVESPSALPVQTGDNQSVRSLDLVPPSVSGIAGKSPPPSRPTSLSRARRWSEMAPSAAVQALASALYLGPPEPLPPVDVDDIASPAVEYRVIEEYNAPIWVPDSRATQCKCCKNLFGMLRRKHHCRLCGSVFCWACSSKYFIIPGSLLPRSTANETQQPDRLARSCDACYAAVFEPPTPSSRFLTSYPSNNNDEILRQYPTATAKQTQARCTIAPAENRISRVLNPQTPDAPLFDFEVSSPSIKPIDEASLPFVSGGFGMSGEGQAEVQASPPRRTRKSSAVNELKRVLSR
ncbi:hypothetical protein JCM11641_001965 [Rhodosporidiobolus odoratus]